MPGDQLPVEGRSWLRRVVSFRGQRLTLSQHREVLTLATWIALLIACVEYDSGDRQAAETTRRLRCGHLARRARAESVGTHGEPQEHRSRARPRAPASRSHAVPR
jgi:hypothetical protein